MTKKTNNGVDKTLRRLSLDRETPKSAFILLLLLYGIATFLTISSSNTQAEITLFGETMRFSALTGVFSMLGSTCIIVLVMLFRKVGYFTAMFLLIVQLPGLIINIVVRHSVKHLPGLFTSFMIIIAITIIFLSNRKILAYQKSIRDQAVTDSLTGLPNRFACTELMQDLLRRNSDFVVVSADLNDFKSINDTMGHSAGDAVLIEVARRWRELANNTTTETTEFVARNSADEFILIISDYDSLDDVEKTIEAYKAELEKKMTIDDCDYYMTACYGYAVCPDDSTVIDNIFTFADAAMHEVKDKESGHGISILRYTSEILNAEKTIAIERKIRNALEQDKLFYHLQPQYDIDHKLRGFEALARMRDDDGSYISPVDFIPVAEKTGLVDRIDMKVYEMAVDFIAKVIAETGRHITISVNVSVRHLMKNNFIEEIRRVLEEHNVSADHIEIEITESIMIDSAEKALERIEQLKAMGMKVAIDDFGTGYSSLSYLNSFPSDLLKIDKSFIDKMNLSDSSRQYVAMIISIGHILDLKVISEGVESADQVDVLKDIGCDYIQGYVWGKPMPPEEAGKLVAESA
ncbi:MAG: EAL domain-containing protein [Clostridiales bacterium]|nr:EAL domain-containing protein [Clostridiales bacterium]